MAHDQRFRKREHLRLHSDIARVFGTRCTAADDLLIVHVAKNQLGWSRLGVSVAKRIGNAVCRNTIRRRIREAFRTGKADFPSGFDFVFVARAGAKDPHGDLARSMRTVTKRAIRRCRARRNPNGASLAAARSTSKTQQG